MAGVINIQSRSTLPTEYIKPFYNDTMREKSCEYRLSDNMASHRSHSAAK